MRRFEITMLDDGGFTIGSYRTESIGYSADPGVPRFACSQLGDALAYLEKQFKEAERLKHTDAGSHLNRPPISGSYRLTELTEEQKAVFARAATRAEAPPSQRVQPPPAPPATKVPTRLSDGLPIGTPPEPAPADGWPYG